MNDAAGNLAEAATYCKTGDTFCPGLANTADGVGHQLCPDDLSQGADEVTDANPSNWYVRVMFDELLDPSIEDLVPILDDTGMDTGTVMGTLANTQPFTLQCQSVTGTNALVDVPYDGYYSPAGNKITWPVGPSLVIVPNEPARVATQSECQITLKDNIKDKDGNPVPAEQRGPYKFKIAPVAVVAADTSPADGDAVDAIAAGVDLTFNTAIDPASTSGLVTFTPDPGNDFVQAVSDTEYFFAADFEVSASYMWALKAGAMIKDQCGRATTVGATSVDTGDAGSFKTNALMFKGIAPFDTQMNAKPSSKVVLKFNQFMDPTTLAASEYTITPAVQGSTAYYDTSLNLIVDGEYKPDTDYTFTLKAGATIDDCPGGEFGFGGCGPKSATGGTFTNASDQVVHFHTAPIALTTVSPADLDTVTLDSTGKVTIDLTFNQDMDPASLANTEYSISPAITFAAPVNPSTAPMTDPPTIRNVIELVSTAAVPPGDYTFTLKMGAAINDKLTTPDVYTQAADKVIHFTVAAAPTTTAPACF